MARVISVTMGRVWLFRTASREVAAAACYTEGAAFTRVYIRVAVSLGRIRALFR